MGDMRLIPDRPDLRGREGADLALPRLPIFFGRVGIDTYICRERNTSMDTSDFLASLLGPFFLVLGVGMAVSPTGWRIIVEEFLASRALIFLAGLLAFLPGLAIVLTHNVWSADWRVVITLIGWLGVIGGTFRLLFPMQVRAIGATMIARAEGLRVAGVVAAVLGLFLVWFGFIA
jgi:hypothetical protein